MRVAQMVMGSVGLAPPAQHCRHEPAPGAEHTPVCGSPGGTPYESTWAAILQELRMHQVRLAPT